MPSPQETPVKSVVVPFERENPPAPLGRLLRHGMPERWQAADRSAHAPHLVAVPADDGEDWTAAALVTARPHTAYLKIVDAVGDVRAAVAAVVAHARGRGLAQVKWEGWTARPEDAAAAGFAALRPPLAQAEDAAGPATGYVRWLHDGAVAEPSYGAVAESSYGSVAEPPYYGQTTHFTCGAVTALVARAHAGALPVEALDRRAELTLWRDATNHPACEPVGLGVAVRRAWPSSSVTVHLDTDRPVLLDHLPENEREWRALLQDTSRTEADRTGVPVDPRHLTLAAVRSAIGRREQVLLLVSLDGMQGFDVPHWVLCHGVVPGAVVIEDPWANASTGDTWVDAHLLPVADPALDTMSVISADRFRGAVTIGPPRPHDPSFASAPAEAP
ncbi:MULTISPECIES: peptidase C39 family protein [Streptomyces]|uniref:peptidase C39 family protein n=1 Tax=Streptomyces TaxID=1883 RepID=UPI000CD549A7|nr:MULTISPECIES: peptidase C39 family protein [unclassified Streptomyces]AWL41072.1 acetyltransferase [Streptomyces sp. SM18]